MKKEKIIPLSLMVAVIILDQLTKSLIINNIPVGTIGCTFFGDFIRIIHVTNTGAAFSMGQSFSNILRMIFLCIIPLAVLLFVLFLYFKTDDFTTLQRWLLGGILGGGFGNLFDRFFRPSGVIDFIDVKFYGLFGLDRWPTFNVADSFILVCVIILAITFLGGVKKND